ncbi:MAG: hypothetical protein WAW79_07910 [Steroidobacteraceae bacterium]
MHRPLIRKLALAALLVANTAGHAENAGTRAYELPNLDIFELEVPAGWNDTIDQPGDGGPPTIHLRPTEGEPFEIYVTPAWPEGPEETAPEVEALREQVRSAAERVRERVDEPPPEIRRLQGESGVGFYFAATDRAPQPEDHRYTNQGALQVGELTVMFTILTNPDQEAVVELALAMLTGATHRRTGPD